MEKMGFPDGAVVDLLIIMGRAHNLWAAQVGVRNKRELRHFTVVGIKAGSKGKEPFRRPLRVTRGPFHLSSLSEML